MCMLYIYPHVISRQKCRKFPPSTPTRYYIWIYGIYGYTAGTNVTINEKVLSKKIALFRRQ